MKTKLSLLTALAVVVLAGCQTPQTVTQPIASGPPEISIDVPAEAVRSATVRTMSGRAYALTPVGTDTLLFDRTADLGSTLRVAFIDGREAWRRVRIRLIPAGAGTRVTAEPSLVINRGEINEREEPDESGSARQAMEEILEKIRVAAGG